MSTCYCAWDCSHAWCGCAAHRELACVCGVRPNECPVHEATNNENEEA